MRVQFSIGRSSGARKLQNALKKYGREELSHLIAENTFAVTPFVLKKNVAGSYDGIRKTLSTNGKSCLSCL